MLAGSRYVIWYQGTLQQPSASQPYNKSAVIVIMKILECNPVLFPFYDRCNVKIVESCCECC